MNILIFAHSGNDRGGASLSLLSIIEYLIQNKAKILVVFPEEGHSVNLLKERSVPTLIIPYPLWISPTKIEKKLPFSIATKNYIKRRIYMVSCLIAYFKAFKYFREIREGINPDLVYTNTITHPLGILFALIYNKSHVWHIREFVEEDHQKYFVFSKRIVKLFLKQSSKNIFVSNALKEKFFKIQTKKNIVIYNGTLKRNKIKCISRRIEGFKPNCNVNFLSVGSFTEGKRHDVAIKTISFLKRKHGIDCCLRLVGHGPSEFYKALIEELNLQKEVEIFGHTKDIFKFYEKSDFLIMGSNHEAFGRVTIEAMAYGVIPIGRNSGGTSEVIQEGVTGFLFNNENEIEEKVLFLLHNKEIASKMKFDANKRVCNFFSEEKYVKSVYEIFVSLI